MTLNLEDPGHCCKEFATFYHNEVNAEKLSVENLHLRNYMKNIHTNSNENITITDPNLVMEEVHIEDTF